MDGSGLAETMASVANSAVSTTAVADGPVVQKGVLDFLNQFRTDVWGSTHGKVLLTVWGAFPFALLILGWRKRINSLREKKARMEAQKQKKLLVEQQEDEDDSSKLKEMKKRSAFLPKLKWLLSIMTPSLLSNSGLSIIAYTAVLCSRVWITLKIASLVGSLGSMMGKRDFKSMFLQQAAFGLWCYPAALSNGLMKYFEKKISLQFRSALVAYLHERYISGRVFYKLKNSELENIDQQITADVELFSSTVTFVYGHILKPTLDGLFLCNYLGQTMGFKQLAAFFAYFFGSSQILALVKPSFSRMVTQKQELEGSFRADHARILHYSEEISFVGGDTREKEIVDASFKNLADQQNQSLLSHLWVDTMDSYVMKYGGSMMAYSALIPSVYVNWNNMDSQQAIQHYLTSSTMLLSLGNAIKDVLLSYKEVAKLEGLTNRVYDLFQKVEEEADNERRLHEAQHTTMVEGAASTIERSDEINYIQLDNVDIWTPSSANNVSSQLVAQLNLVIKPGEHLLVSGVNGAGKSSLFRTIGELWPLKKGHMKLPPSSAIYFVSQNSYMCPGTLRDQLTYPQVISNPTAESDAELVSFLKMVELETSLLSRFTFDSIENWNLLSGGEKQRLIIARLYYHRPQFGILDECTSAISVELEHTIFKQAKALNITLITIAHNPALLRHHVYELVFEKVEGRWRLEKVESEVEEEGEVALIEAAGVNAEAK